MDFGSRARFLLAKIVARNTDDNQTRLTVLAPEMLKPFVLGREAAFGGCVDDQNGLAFEVSHGDGLAAQGRDGEVVETVRHGDPSRDAKSVLHYVALRWTLFKHLDTLPPCVL